VNFGDPKGLFSVGSELSCAFATPFWGDPAKCFTSWNQLGMGNDMCDSPYAPCNNVVLSSGSPFDGWQPSGDNKIKLNSGDGYKVSGSSWNNIRKGGSNSALNNAMRSLSDAMWADRQCSHWLMEGWAAEKNAPTNGFERFASYMSSFILNSAVKPRGAGCNRWQNVETGGDVGTKAGDGDSPCG
jgi:hypothetical protein